MQFTITTLAVHRCTVTDGNATCQELNFSNMLRQSTCDDAVSEHVSLRRLH